MIVSAEQCKAAGLLRVEELCALHGIRKPTVTYDLVGSAAGVAFVRERWIRINMIMFREQFTETLAETIPHELAHVWLQDLGIWERDDHGRGWAGLMRRMGVPPTPCHNFAVDAALSPTGYFLYKCLCRSGNRVGLEMHRQIQSDPSAFRCDRCREQFVYVPEDLEATLVRRIKQPVYGRGGRRRWR